MRFNPMIDCDSPDEQILPSEELIAKIIMACDLVNHRKGLMCINPECIFNLTDRCGLQNVYIIQGKCPYYNPELMAKFNELFPEMAKRPGSTKPVNDPE